MRYIIILIFALSSLVGNAQTKMSLMTKDSIYSTSGDTIFFRNNLGTVYDVYLPFSDVDSIYTNPAEDTLFFVNSFGDVYSVAFGGGGGGSTEARTVNNALVTTTDEDDAVSDVFGANDPRAETIPQVFVNGVLVYVTEDKTGECYFAEAGVPGTAIPFASLNGDEDLQWNGSVAGYQLAATDRIIVHFTTN